MDGRHLADIDLTRQQGHRYVKGEAALDRRQETPKDPGAAQPEGKSAEQPLLPACQVPISNDWLVQQEILQIAYASKRAECVIVTVPRNTFSVPLSQYSTTSWWRVPSASSVFSELCVKR
jgi:hypothetical protein